MTKKESLPIIEKRTPLRSILLLPVISQRSGEIFAIIQSNQHPDQLRG
jgi:hypothetical protein